MSNLTRIRSLGIFASLAMAVAAFVPGSARTDTPMCDAVVNDPTIATCTCICEAGSLFSGCLNLTAGTSAPTPNQCPDMLQGRRVLSAGDALTVADPFAAGAGTDARVLLYKTKNDTSLANGGLGIVDGTPVSTSTANVPCTGVSGQPFPQQTRFARLFNLPYDWMVTLRPTNEVDSECIATSTSAQSLTIVMESPNSGSPTVPAFAAQWNPQWIQLAIDDFNYDGFDDILVLNIDSIQVLTAVDPYDPTKGLVQMGGVSTRLPSGAYEAPINEPTTGDFNGDGLLDVAWIGGDFPNKQGNLSVFFATVCPASVTGTICEGAEPFQVILDPASKLFPSVSGATSTIVLDSAPLTPTNCGVVQTPHFPSAVEQDVLRPGTVVLGNFENGGFNSRGAPMDGLVVAYVSGSEAGSGDPCSTDVQYWSFAGPGGSTGANATSWAVQRGATIKGLFPAVQYRITINGTQYSPTITLYGKAAHLDWYGALEQAVITVGGNRFKDSGNQPDPGSFWFPLTVSVSGAGDQAQPSACAAAGGSSGSGDHEAPFVWGGTVGVFSTSTTVNPNNPTACGDFADAAPGDCPYNPQIALFVSGDKANSAKQPSVRLYTVQASQPNGADNGFKCDNDPSIAGFLPIQSQTNDINGFSDVDVRSLRAGSLLRAGDAFGNSMRVGQPTVTRISQHSQPQIIIQAPPSLIDYVQPNSGDSPTPAIVNFTRAPNNYQAQIEFDTGSQDTASTQRKGSFTASTTETTGAEVKFKAPLVSTVDIKNQESWSQFNNTTNNQQLGTYSTTRLQTGGAIGADDQVWWTQTTFNVFHFPVLGQTNCPGTVTCDPSDPNTTGCSAAANGAELTCSPSGSGCNCLSEGASDSLCPQLPSEAGSLACAAESGEVCCSLLQEQLNVSFSGPEEVTRSSSPGASIEWYQPKHEPAQILSYPSNSFLLQARTPGSQALANLDPFSTGTNNTSESISWTCGTTSNVSTGTTTRHSFESDTSLTMGTNKLAMAEGGVNVSAGFDYQNSDSISTLNSYSVGVTASSSIGLSLEGAGFFNVDQYAYSVAGLVLGAVKPQAVLDNPNLKVCPEDNPDCSTVQQVQADCTTTGPVTVAFAADPTSDVSGLWWSSTAPYLGAVDVALNNPSRWRRVVASQVVNPALQCRGPANTPVCYTSNQPPTATDASSVWDALFYNMKGLLVTNGTTGGPLRNTATVGELIYLQARVYNYSLKTMAPGTKVYARFYRQQLDVNNLNGAIAVADYATGADGNPLPAVPIGPTGLGDTDPIPVVSPTDGSATIPPFNDTSDPSFDNISLATTSYTAGTDDACEYDDGVQSCTGAYYAYWVTVWAEDAGGNVLPELYGHGLKTSGAGAFDPATAYAFITDVPLEAVSFAESVDSFSNNVGMFKMVFAIVPASTSTSLAASLPGALALDRLHISRDKTVLGEPVVVTAQVVSEGAAAPGATVIFSDGDPLDGGRNFDAEFLPFIRARDALFVRVPYNPETCGTHDIYVEVAGRPRELTTQQIAVVDVGIDAASAIDYLIKVVKGLTPYCPGKADPRNQDEASVKSMLGGKAPGVRGKRCAFRRVINAAEKLRLISQLLLAERAFDAGRTNKGIFHLNKFIAAIEAFKRKDWIVPEKASVLIAQANQIIGCVR